MKNQSNVFVQYATKHKTTLVEAIQDRDWPMNAEQIAVEWFNATGEKISAEDLQACRPDSERVLRKERAYWAD